jgi:hypothetical protein
MFNCSNTLFLALGLVSQAPIAHNITTLVDANVYLRQDQGAIFRLHALKQGALVSVKVEGNGKGDIDCYVIVDGRIVAKDESKKDSCDIGTFLQKPDATVWIVQHGNVSVDYHVVIRQ